MGESVLAIVFTAAVAHTGNPFPIGIMGDSFATTSMVLGGLGFLGVIFFTYRWAEKLAKS
jgi:hypothetical protein